MSTFPTPTRSEEGYPPLKKDLIKASEGEAYRSRIKCSEDNQHRRSTPKDYARLQRTMDSRSMHDDHPR